MLRACCLFVLALSAVAPRLADACSQRRCAGGSIAPLDTGTVPANLPGLLWHPLIDQAKPAAADPSKLTITRLGDPTPIAFTAQALANPSDVLLVPDAPLTVGETYEVNDATTCDGQATAISRSLFSVRAATPLPATLGTLAASAQLIGRLDVSTSGGSCTAEVAAAQRTIWLAMDPGTDEWLELLQVQAFVDDQPWGAVDRVWGAPGTRTAGATVQVHRTCMADDASADQGLGAGTHTIRMEATLPGTAVRVASSTITFDLDCKGHGKDEPPAEDAGCNAAGAGSLSWLVGLVAVGALVVRRRA